MTELEYVGTFPFTFSVPSQTMDIGFRKCPRCGKHMEHWATQHDGSNAQSTPVVCLHQALVGMVAAAMVMIQHGAPEGWPLLKATTDYQAEAVNALDPTGAEHRRRMH